MPSLARIVAAHLPLNYNSQPLRATFSPHYREVYVRYAKAGDLIMLVGNDRKPFIRTLQPGHELQTHRGNLSHDALIGLPIGSQVRTHIGYSFFLLWPATEELVRNIQRKSQIIFPKDAGYIVLKLNVKPGSTVVEAGTGSGGLTSVFATQVGDTGHVYSYDSRDDMQLVARDNLRKLKLDHRVTLIHRDVAEGFDQQLADCLFFDLQQPWHYLDHARTIMLGGAVLGSLVPTVNQLARLIQALDDHPDFAFVEADELILRPWKTIPARVRPDDRIVGHTGFLVFARAVLPSDGDDVEASQGQDEAKTSV